MNPDVNVNSNNNTTNITINFGDVYNVNVSQGDTLDALQLFQGLDDLISSSVQNLFDFWSPIPDFTSLPYPEIGLSSAPAGKGLEAGPCPWGDCAVQTAGGYTIVADGSKASWSIYGPDQQPGDTPLAQIWGDPHFKVNGQQLFDFTKDSDLILPDGTLISIDTTSETGKSVTQGLTIVNGADRIEMTGINTNNPQLGNMTRDGYEWRADHVGDHSRDTYRFGGSAEDISVFKEVDGIHQGEVTGSYFDKTTNRYEQVLDRGELYWVDPGLKPEFGTEAWGNEFRSNLVDTLSEFGPAETRGVMSRMVAVDHMKTEFMDALQDFVFENLLGGLFTAFTNPFQFFSAVSGLNDVLGDPRERTFDLFANRASLIA